MYSFSLNFESSSSKPTSDEVFSGQATPTIVLPSLDFRDAMVSCILGSDDDARTLAEEFGEGEELECAN